MSNYRERGRGKRREKQFVCCYAESIALLFVCVCACARAYERKSRRIRVQSVVYVLSGTSTDFVAAVIPYVKKFKFDAD